MGIVPNSVLRTKKIKNLLLSMLQTEESYCDRKGYTDY